MKTLILKLGATGDVVRTTTLLRILEGEIIWITADENINMIKNAPQITACIPWSKRATLVNEDFELVINLEDSIEAAGFLYNIRYKNLFGSYLHKSGKIFYTESSAGWFDLSIISRYGKKKADELKLQNRKSYQERIFEGLDNQFRGEQYVLPKTDKSGLIGDIAISPKSGNVWPMKNWEHYDKLALKLKMDGYKVNFLPKRNSLLEHVADVRNHRYLISGDSLPMHIALGSGIKCLTIFICTSPWEIYYYGLQKKIVSPNLSKYFYRRDFVEEATRSISLEQVYEAVSSHISERSDERMYQEKGNGR